MPALSTILVVAFAYVVAVLLLLSLLLLLLRLAPLSPTSGQIVGGGSEAVWCCRVGEISLRGLDTNAPPLLGEGAKFMFIVGGAKRVLTYRAHSCCMASSDAIVVLNCGVGA